MTPPRTEFNDRHREILHAAMVLVAERGLAGSSLRELARRVGMSQPSLYHYFDTKDDLVHQIIRAKTAQHFGGTEQLQPVHDLNELILGIEHFILGLYSQDDYVTFVRFLFVVTIEREEWSDVLRTHFIEGSRAEFRRLAAPLVASGELYEDDLDYVRNLLSGTMILEMLNHRVLLREPMEFAHWLPEIDFLTDTIAGGLRARAARRKKEHA